MWPQGTWIPHFSPSGSSSCGNQREPTQWLKPVGGCLLCRASQGWNSHPSAIRAGTASVQCPLGPLGCDGHPQRPEQPSGSTVLHAALLGMAVPRAAASQVGGRGAWGGGVSSGSSPKPWAYTAIIRWHFPGCQAHCCSVLTGYSPEGEKGNGGGKAAPPPPRMVITRGQRQSLRTARRPQGCDPTLALSAGPSLGPLRVPVLGSCWLPLESAQGLQGPVHAKPGSLFPPLGLGNSLSIPGPSQPRPQGPSRRK